MRNANAIAAGIFCLAILIVSIGGCDTGPAPRRQASSAASPAPHGRPLAARYQVDVERGRVWLLTQQGLFVHDAARPERVAVALPDWITANADYACPPDIALGPNGEALVTSNVVPTLWRIDPDTFAVTVHPLALDADTDKDVGFSGLVFSAQHGAFLAASSHHGSLWRIDSSLERARKIPLSAPVPEACGLALRPQGAQAGFRPAPNLCVLTPRGSWSIIFTPDGRAAYVSAAPCTDGA